MEDKVYFCLDDSASNECFRFKILTEVIFQREHGLKILGQDHHGEDIQISY